MSSPPTGTVTFLFTDIEGSTRLWERNTPAMRVALARHDEILRSTIKEHGGHVFKTVGDAFCASFGTATAALEAALVAQRSLHSEPWEEGCAIRARMALHTGVVDERDGDYFGPPVNRVARLLSAGHGGQTLLSLATQELVRDGLPPMTELRDMGEWRLKDLFRPERVFQLVVPDLPREFPPLRTLEGRRNNLPPQPTPLIGREREVGEVRERLGRGEVRLLTLTGPGGAGKTRLALQAGADLLEAFEHGVFFVDLSALTDPALFIGAVAGALGLRESGDVALSDLLKEYLSRRELLLILDNFEQLLSAAPLAGEILSAALRVKVLVTSRIPLELYGEHEYAVPPLSVPDPNRLPNKIEALSQYEAVRLFIERAGAAKAGFEITAENAPAVAEICARLDGLPLAIELAAARIKLLPPKALLDRLSNRLKLLTGGAKDLPERQRTLRGAIDWSHDLLNEGEKILFRRLSVFSGGRTLEAVGVVCDAEDDLPVDALDGVSSLLDKSLLRQQEGPGDEVRFVMLETIHEYARERLEESGEAEGIKRAHAGYFLALVEEAEPELKGPDQLLWLERLEAEHDNVRAALSWSLEHGEAETTLRLAGALWWFWFLRGYGSEGLGWLERALTQPGRSSSARARVLHGAGWLVEGLGDYGRAMSLYEEGMNLFREANDEEGVAFLACCMGWAALLQGDFDKAIESNEEGLALSRRSGSEWSATLALHNLGCVAIERQDYARATPLLEEALVLARKVGDQQLLSICLADLGVTAMYAGDYERAETLLEQGMALQEEIGEKEGMAGNLRNLALTLLYRGDHERAKAILGKSLALSQELDYKLYIADGLNVSGRIAGERNQAVRAARLWGAAEGLRESIGAPLPTSERELFEPHIVATRHQLGEAAWVEAWEGGRAMTMEEAVSYALEENADQPRPY